MVWTRSSNRLFVELTVPEILRCIIDFGVLAWNCHFTPLLGSFWAVFPLYNVEDRPAPLNHRPWAETWSLRYSAKESVQRFEVFDFPVDFRPYNSGALMRCRWFKMAAVRHLGFVIGSRRPPTNAPSCMHSGYIL